MSEPVHNSSARDSILSSIRAHLAASKPHDQRVPVHRSAGSAAQANGSFAAAPSNIEVFKTNLEAVMGHCVIARTELEIVHALTRIITELKQTQLNPRRIALSDAKGLERLVRLIAVQADVTIAPSSSELFGIDIGITTAQAAIAETGTLVLDSSRERNRLISLVPPVHIAIVDASNIYSTLGETLSVLRTNNEISPVITFITGPSRTADIELTLAIGVHGPQELYVIISDGPALTD
ncbi:MAG TPA: lactate utilization protein [Pyrinomonadaceae bacterium]|nr:lactate utilization protein [Pyrinomonadaceae bacterium]